MADKPNFTFAKRLRAARPREKIYEVRDDIVTGLGVAIQPTGVRTFFLTRMVHGKRRYARIGSPDNMTVPEARREARRLIASYIEPARKDSGPRTPGHPMTAFAEEFLERHGRHWKPRTVGTNSRIVQKNILPAFGHMTVDAITADDVKSWFASLGACAAENYRGKILHQEPRMARNCFHSRVSAAVFGLHVHKSVSVSPPSAFGGVLRRTLPWNNNPRKLLSAGDSGGTAARISVSHTGSRTAPRHQCPNADCGPGQTCIRATRTTARTASLPETNTLYTIPRTHAASCCSLRVRAPAPPGWKLAWNKTLTH